MERPSLTLVEPPDAKTALVRELLSAFTQQDRHAIDGLIAADCVWRVPGRNPVSGEYVGRDAVIGLFRHLRRVFDVPARFEIVDMTTTGDRVVCHQYGVVVVDGRSIRLKECLVFRVAGAQIVEVDEFQFDLDGFDGIFRGHPRPEIEAG